MTQNLKTIERPSESLMNYYSRPLKKIYKNSWLGKNIYKEMRSRSRLLHNTVLISTGRRFPAGATEPLQNQILHHTEHLYFLSADEPETMETKYSNVSLASFINPPQQLILLCSM